MIQNRKQDRLYDLINKGAFLPISALDVSTGRIDNSVFNRKSILAEMTDVDTTERIIGQGVASGLQITFPTSARVLSLASTSTNDIAGGSGCQTIFVEGLDTNKLPIGEFVTMNGQTEVDTIKLFLRITNLFAQNTGAGNTNAGIIRVSDSTDTFVGGVPQTRLYEVMAIGHSLGKTGIYTVPFDCTFYFKQIIINTDLTSNKIITIKVYKRAPNFTTTDTWYLDNVFYVDRSQQIYIDGQANTPGGGDIKITALTDAGTAKLAIKIHGILKKN
tara:strand:- start:1464 stop:2285 length:822 start_codon:yes stop_codon:yes gene_type:complete